MSSTDSRVMTATRQLSPQRMVTLAVMPSTSMRSMTPGNLFRALNFMVLLRGHRAGRHGESSEQCRCDLRMIDVGAEQRSHAIQPVAHAVAVQEHLFSGLCHTPAARVVAPQRVEKPA